MIIIKMFLFTNFLFNFFFILGNSFISLTSKNNKVDNSITILIGLSLSLIILQISYFFLEFSLNNSIILLIFFTFFFCALGKAKFKNMFQIPLILRFLFISLILVTFASLIPEQFFIFRGNYWDKINYVNAAYSIFNHNFSQIINFGDQTPNIKFLSRLENIQHRPLVSLILALGYYLNDNDIFRAFFLIQLIFFTFIFFSLRIFFSKFNNNSTICAFLFSISFWTIYVFEIDSFSHFFALPFFYLGLFFIINLKKDLKKETSSSLLIFAIVLMALLNIYPEIFLIFILLLLLFLVFKFKFSDIIIFFKNNLKIIFLFIVLSLFSYETNIITTISQIKIAYLSSIDWWGYYGGFLFGKNNNIFDILDINKVRNIYFESGNFFVFVKYFVLLLIEKDLLGLLLNIFPSSFGFYYITPNNLNFYNLIYILILNIFLLKVFYNNLKFIFKDNSNISYLIKISFFVFIILSISFLINNNIWSIIKLYSYIGIFIFILLFFNFEKKNLIKINKFFLILVLIFPFYKYSSYNFGIFKNDSFPSIIDKQMKSEINWSFPKKTKIICKNILVDIKKELVIDYVRIKLLSYNYDNTKRYLFESRENDKKFNCKLVLSGGKFKFEKRN